MANAGIASGGTVLAMDPDAWEKIIEVNVIGVYRTIRAALPHLIESRGYALPVASVAAIAHAPLMSAYCATKAGVEAFADSLRIEVAHHGVDVGCAYFSWIDTEMVRGADRISAFEIMRKTLKPPFSKTYPVDVAADAVVRGHRGPRQARLRARAGSRHMQPLRGLLEPQVAARGAPRRCRRSSACRTPRSPSVARPPRAASAPVGAGGLPAVTTVSRALRGSPALFAPYRRPLGTVLGPDRRQRRPGHGLAVPAARDPRPRAARARQGAAGRSSSAA